MGIGAPELIVILIGGVISFFIYFLPSILGRRKHNFTAIFLLNLFLGWTAVGWIVALIWALSNDAPPVYINNMPPPPQSKSKADELAKLAKLHSDGVLTQEEFEAEKRRLLYNS
ncbi:superinfection immunity protein [Mucilaginibacter psychrotolerans]|uniref:Superinfection immunity protein n=1 Tax=Mucilaginibacter psychrotolerans TaxID=1524096 RepID=A0A4Y8S2H5_9SPHI|nr:superinfection immunity protein [Mucilaginibacter psychrotolerans]TFF33232.1 superinfection immunity protein [Mucilaginibacter psychrotolerans]